MADGVKSLDKDIVEFIKDFVGQCLDKHIKTKYVNELLRDDIISILEENSIVVYYPLADEENNGFLARDFLLYGQETPTDFVFINTAKEAEKQAFAAAHELGHIWGLDVFLQDKGVELDKQLEEQVMNRFAAELLIPYEHFEAYLALLLMNGIIKNKNNVQKQVEVGFTDVIRLVTALMNEFFVPYKAIIWRLFELHHISKDSADRLLDTSEEKIKSSISVAISEGGYNKLLKITKKKWINNLPDLLKKVEEKGTISSSKIASMREEFGISTQKATLEDKAFEVLFLSNGSDSL